MGLRYIQDFLLTKGEAMRIGMLTWGSHGDIRPMLALAQGLQAAGNDVHLVLVCVDSDAYSGMTSAQGVEITVLASPVLSPQESRDVIRMAYAMRNPMAQMAAMLRLCLAPVEDAMFDASRRLAAESDLLIGHFFMHPLQIAAEQAGKPYVSVVLSHSVIPTDFSHPAGVPGIGKLGNRMLWRLTRFLVQRALGHYPNRLRRQLGMPPVIDLMTQVWLSDRLTLVGISPHMCEAQADWPASLRVCGFLDIPNLAIEGALPAALNAFLAAGDAPVYMTFGSWMPKDATGQAQALRLLTGAARRAGCRAIIQAPEAQACGFVSDAHFLYVAAAPHHLVFPHCRAIVHHGGAGTTQSATLAGKPSVVVANLAEQRHWGQALYRLGIGARPDQRRSATPASLARRIRRVLASADMKDRARAIGTAMRQENGVAEAVGLVTARFGAGRVSSKAGQGEPA